jgi:molybdenum cofactor cytidylyltransferase
MGRPKPLLPWRGTTLIEYQVDSLFQAGISQIVVVLGHESAAVARFVDERSARRVVNESYRNGRTGSIKTGLAAVDTDADAVLFLGVDQPRTPDLIRQIVEAHTQRNALITSPRYQGRGGHPLVFSISLREELASTSEENQGVREVFRRHHGEVNEVEIDDPMVRLDLNTPDDYEKARAIYDASAK